MARSSHTATLLANGKILLAGGQGTGGTPLASAELYDPAVGIWTSTGSMSSARAEHTATLLPNGKVLVAGGKGSGWVSQDGAELYDPTTGTWSSTGSLTVARAWHTATLLPSGDVLAVGGYGSSSYLDSAELYDPATGSWRGTDSMGNVRGLASATLLLDGQVLVAAGTGGVRTSAELFDCGLAFQSDWRPTLSQVTSPLLLGRALEAAGSGFRGYRGTEASGGGTNNSATNYPLVQLRRVDNEQVRWLLPDPATPFTDALFTSAPVRGFPAGPSLVTVFVNGIPSRSEMIKTGAPSIWFPLAAKN
jgi:hypothetical protein